MRRKNKIGRGSKKIYFYVSAIVVVVITTVILAVQSATVGSELAYFEKQEKTLVSENAVLTDKLLRSESLEKFSAKAEELGFEKPTNIVYISDETEIAQIR